jgi:branched-chain amino acid transport system substrate-binding protein
MRIAAVLLGLAAAQPLLAQTGPVKVQGVVELSGTGATSGTNFNDGVKLAVKEINASGGTLGRPIEYAANDTQSQAQVAKALAVKAIDDGAYVVTGPVFLGSIIVSMAETRRAPRGHRRRRERCEPRRAAAAQARGRARRRDSPPAA